LKDEKKVSLFYSPDLGENWNVIIEDIENLGTYYWEVPEELGSGSVQLKVQGEILEIVSDDLAIETKETGSNGPATTGSSSADPHHAVTEGLIAVIIGLLVAIAIVVTHKPGTRGGGRHE